MFETAAVVKWKGVMLFAIFISTYISICHGFEQYDEYSTLRKRRKLNAVNGPLITCDQLITRHISYLLNLPEAESIPFGRAHIARHFGVALYAHRIHNTTSTLPDCQQLPSSIAINDTFFQVELRTCRLPGSVLNIHRGNESSACDISIYARIMGSSIYMGEAISSNFTKRNEEHPAFNNSTTSTATNDILNQDRYCQWIVSFKDIRHPGKYSIEIFMMWLNELAEPEENVRKRSKSERINDGLVVNLGGIGSHPSYIRNATLSYYNFDGHIVKEHNSREVFLLINGTRVPFGSWDYFLRLNFTSDHIKEIPGSLLSRYPVGLTLPQFATEAEVLQHKLSLPTPISYPDIENILKGLGHYEALTVDSQARREALVFGLPVAVDEGDSTLHISFPSISPQQQLPLCVSGFDQGYWVNDPICKPMQVIQGEPKNRSHFVGHECHHALWPSLVGHQPIEFAAHRRRSMVWRPLHCSLTQFRLNVVVEESLSYCENIQRFVRMTSTAPRSQSQSQPQPMSFRDYHSLLLSEGEAFHRDYFRPSTSSSSSYHVVKSLAGFGLRQAGVGFIAGFGDSVGDELRVNLVDLLGGGLEWGIPHTPGGLTCHNNKIRIHRLKSEVPSRNMLVECVEFMAEAMPRAQPLFLPSEQLFFSTGNDNQTAGVGKLRNESVPITTVVLVTNFMCQHSVWTNTLPEIEVLLKEQAQQHAALADKLLREKKLIYRRIFYTGVAIQGFRTGGLTPARARWFNNKAREILGRHGWEVLDAYALTYGRPEGSVDGVHYKGGVSIAIADVLMNMLCNGPCQKM